MSGVLRFARSLWLDALIGWNEGRAQVNEATAKKARSRAERYQAEWYALNPHPFNPKPKERA